MKNQVDVDTWDWDFGGVVVAGGTPRKHRFDYYPPGGTNNVILNVFSVGKACSFPITKTINFHDAYANFGINDTTLCANTPLVLTDSSGGADTWQWVIVPNGQTYSTQDPGPISLSTPGNYTIALRISDQASGCKDTLVKEMEVVALPTFTVSSSKSICEGASTVLTATNKPNHTYSWTPTTNLSTPSSSSTNASPLVTTPYTVLVTNADGCSDSKTTTVTVFGPISSFPFDTACIVAGQTISLGTDLGSNYTYDWTDGDTKNLSCTSCPVTNLKVVEVGTYVFKVTDKLNCFTSTNSYDICVSPDHTVDVPSAFTPDGDGVNDVIYVDGWGIETLKMFRIFNRWGEVVFESSDIKIGWNGNYKFSPQPSDTYVYQVDGVFYGGEDFTKSGTITLIR
jgi:gliding motility-associated-like protein